MRMIRPQLKLPTITIAEEQEEYLPMVVAVHDNPEYGSRNGQPNTLISCWRLSAVERELIATGADIYLALLTFGDPMQPVILQVGKEQLAAVLGVEVEAPSP
jgi:hypothetical protein